MDHLLAKRSIRSLKSEKKQLSDEGWVAWREEPGFLLLVHLSCSEQQSCL